MKTFIESDEAALSPSEPAIQGEGAATGQTADAEAQRRQALFACLARVPAGQVTSYGELAACAGLGRAARWVGRVLGQLPADTRLPWHRVVRADGRLALPPDDPTGAEQRARLQAEGIPLVRARVDMRRHGWRWPERNG